jgi:ribonucleoside-diphosphate reductase alpha chain
VPDAIGIAIERWLQEKAGVQQDLLEHPPAVQAEVPQAVTPRTSVGSAGELFSREEMNAEQHTGACPDCGSQLEYAEGCVKCHVCGSSECG